MPDEKYNLKPSYDWSREVEVVQELSENGIQTMYYEDADTSEDSQETKLLVNHEAFGTVCDWLIRSRQSTITSSNKTRTWKRVSIVMICVLVALVITSAIAFPTMLDKKYSEGFASGQEFAEYIYEQANEKTEQSKADAQSPTAVPFSNGEIIQSPQSSMLCPISVEVSGDAAYYIYLDNTTNSANDMSFMVSPNSTAEVSVPIGTYEIYCACGETWFGPEDKFGFFTDYSKCEGVFDFYNDGQYYQGWTLELYPQQDGNMNTEIISASEFPG